jgi:hypothetical protein
MHLKFNDNWPPQSFKFMSLDPETVTVAILAYTVTTPSPGFLVGYHDESTRELCESKVLRSSE